jgi:hypothetical protein
VPERVQFDGRTEADDALRRHNRIPDDLMVLAENVFLLDSELFGRDTAFCELDATVRHFSDKITTFKLNPGPELFIRIGNIIERLFYKRLFFDFYYDLRIKGRDYLGSGKACYNFDPRIWTKRSDEVAHRFGGALSYQCGNQIRIVAGAAYTFEGRNVPKELEAHLDFNIEF